MKFSVSKEDLSKALKKCIGAVDARANLPVLSCFKITANDDAVTIEATDLSIFIRTTINATVAEPGTMAVAAKKLTQIVSALPNDAILFDAVNSDDGSIQKVSIACRKSNYALVCMGATDYPSAVDVASELSFSINAASLVRNMALVSYARSDDESRKQLNGVLCSLRSGTMTIAATDGRRLAMTEMKLPEDSAAIADADAILPAEFVANFSRMVEGGAEGDIKVAMNNAMMSFSMSNTTIITKLIEGTYPNFRQVIPESTKTTARVARQPLLDIINRVAMVTDEGAVSVNVTMADSQLTAEAKSALVGEASEVIDAGYDGEPIGISFNPLFFIEPLKNMDCDILEMKFNDDSGPCIITDNDGFVYVMMPMRK